MSGTLQDLLAAYRSLAVSGEDMVLATLIATEGSTYRKAGARMLFARDGRRFGVLAGGSFEEELFRHAAPLFAGGGTAIVDMDTPGRGDAASARGFLRDGGARVFLQLVSRTTGYAPLALLAQAAEADRTGVLVTVITSTDPRLIAGTVLLAGAGLASGVPAELAEELQAAANSVAETGDPAIVDHVQADGELEAFYAPVRPPLSLLLLGATPDSVPVMRIARLLGWRVRVVDARGNLAGAGAELGEVVAAPAGSLADAMDLAAVDAAVLLTRNFELDCEYLRALAASPVPYLGLLGSKNRCARLIDSLGEGSRRLAGRVHGPVGLSIGADTPEEIALSITAQIQDEHARRRRAAADARPAEAALAGGVHALLLAAGGSKRFGSFKQLLEFRGESLLRRAARLSSELLEGRVVVVHGPKPTKCQRELAGIDVAHAINENWEGGVATSLRAGIRALPQECAAVLVLLCDQPLVGADQMLALLRAWSAAPERIAASGYADTLGVPAVFPRQYFPQILQLTGDRGAKSVIEANAVNVTAVAIPEAALDIDTQADYAAMLKETAR